MKVIKPNDIKIANLPSELPKTSPIDAIKDFVQIDENYIQYVKAEREGEMLKCFMHPFVEAVDFAYSHHVPLIITPDIIFYLISSATAVHINQNAEKLRDVFVNHEGKKEIEIRRDDFVLNSKSNPPLLPLPMLSEVTSATTTLLHLLLQALMSLQRLNLEGD